VVKRRILKIVIGLIVLITWGACTNKPTEQAEVKSNITYTNTVAAILSTHCAKCHNPKGAGPFSLLDYKQAARKSKTIAKVTRKGYMPPWPADRSYTTFLHQPEITDEEIEALQRWAEAGAPYGDSIELPELVDFQPHFIKKKPDRSVGVVKRLEIPGDNRDRFFALKIPVQLSEPKYLRAIEFVPDNRKLVHHMNGHLVTFDPTKMSNMYKGYSSIEHDSIPARALAYQMGFEQDDGSFPTLTPSVVNYLPGVGGTLYPKGIGGWRVTEKFALYVKDLHIGPSPVKASDSSYFNLYFMDEAPTRPVKELHLGTLGVAPVQPPLVIPPEEVKQFEINYRVPQKISVLTVNPHMHLLGKTFNAYAVTPSGDTIKLIKIDQWDFRWQFFYTYPKPVVVPAGSVIKVVARFDNTSNNKYNPNTPPQVVSERDGSMRTTDEMLQFFINYLPYQKGDENLDLNTDDLE
jgi:mono/diheme cytochrome c family protein